jgi:hypothetical protein
MTNFYWSVIVNPEIQTDEAWPPPPRLQPNEGFFPSPSWFSSSLASRMLGLPLAILILFVAYGSKCLFFPELLQNGIQHHSLSRYWASLVVVLILAGIGFCWSTWDVFRTLQCLKSKGKLLDSLIFLLGVCGLAINCLSGVLALVIPYSYPLSIH